MENILSRKQLLDLEYASPETAVKQLSQTTEFKPIVSTAVKQLQTETASNPVDLALDQTADLMNPSIPRGWYAQRILDLGVDRYLTHASDARSARPRPGGSPAKLFSWFLKRA